MRRVMVRYTVKQGQAEHNEELVRSVYDALHATQPEGLRYATFRLEDGLTFVHIAEVDGEQNPLTQMPAFGAFVAGIEERCDEPPVSSSLTCVGSFGLFAAAGASEI